MTRQAARPPDRWRLGQMRNPLRGFLHGSAALASVVIGVQLLREAAGDPVRQIAVAVFGVSLVALYSTSALYHSAPWPPRWLDRMQRLDHSMIYVLVAGSFTPIGVIVLDGMLRTVVLAVVWSTALAGTVQKTFFPDVPHWVSITGQATLGWFGLVPIIELARRLPFEAVLLAVLGGLAYTMGLIAFSTKRPRLFPRVFSYHEVFHVLVITGSALHIWMTFRYVVPYTG